MNNTVYVMCNTVLRVLIFYCLHFDIIAKSADFPNLQCEKSILLIYLLYSVSKDRFFHNFVILLKWQCRLGKFQFFFFYQFHRVNNQYIHYHIKTLWSLIEIIPFYSAFFFLETTKFSMYKCNVQFVCMYVWFDYSLLNLHY